MNAKKKQELGQKNLRKNNPVKFKIESEFIKTMPVETFERIAAKICGELPSGTIAHLIGLSPEYIYVWVISEEEEVFRVENEKPKPVADKMITFTTEPDTIY